MTNTFSKNLSFPHVEWLRADIGRALSQYKVWPSYEHHYILNNTEKFENLFPDLVAWKKEKQLSTHTKTYKHVNVSMTSTGVLAAVFFDLTDAVHFPGEEDAVRYEFLTEVDAAGAILQLYRDQPRGARR